MKFYKGKKVPIKAWTDYVQVEQEAMTQLENISSLPFIHKHVAAMPDVHWGMGATVGSVIATNKAIVPAAVGVDIGCGMMAIRLDITAKDLPDNLKGLRSAIEAAVPHGRTNNGKSGDRGAWKNTPEIVVGNWKALEPAYDIITAKHPKAKAYNTHQHLGTLGTGNHFIEICLDQNDAVWIMLHSGSRGAGNRIGSYFIEKAKEEMERYFIGDYLPDTNLSYLVEHTELFDDYITAVRWAQYYALVNRQLMMDATVRAVAKELGRENNLSFTEKAINCHHNYVEKENHFGSNVWVTRKGAVRARKEDLGIIPGSMGAKSYIVKGLGNPDSFHSCSHGAGRAMSRGEAKKKISLEEHIKSTEGVECKKDQSVLDESPSAYKDIDAVMASQKDLVKVLYTLKQVVCVKG